MNGLVSGDDQNPVIKNMIHLQVKKQTKVLEKAHKIELKNVKKQAIQLALEFVKTASEDVQKVVTKECQGLYKSFISFKEKTWTEIDLRKDFGDKMVEAEKLVAQTYPIYEQRLRSDPKNPLQLFDCLVP